MRVIVAISGKRGSGKDTFARWLKEHHFPNALICPVAAEFKRLFARKFGLDFQRLLEDRNYKEAHREQMNKYFEEVHAQAPGSEMRSLLDNLPPTSTQSLQLILIPDLRLRCHVTELRGESERSDTCLLLVRLTSSAEVKSLFGWTPNTVVDSHWTETDLDNVDNGEWNWVVDNDGEPRHLLDNIQNFVNRFLPFE